MQTEAKILALKSLSAIYTMMPSEVCDDVNKNIKAVFEEYEGHLKHLNDLTKLQEELGYVRGPVSPVALLGLIGESGEVLAEVNLMAKGGAKEGHKHFNDMSSLSGNPILATVDLCKKMDDLKKLIRKGEMDVWVEIYDPVLFDAELADTFYYLLALATNRGLTVSDLARMGHDKVRAKQAAGGSSEDRKVSNG